MTRKNVTGRLRGRPAAAPSAAMRLAAVAMLVIPLVGLAVVGALYFACPEDIRRFAASPWPKVSAFVAVANVVANWVHYRRTRMGLDIASRILTYVWIVSIIWLMRPILERLLSG